MTLPSDAIYETPFSAYMEAFLADRIVFAASGAARVDWEQPGLQDAGGQLITIRKFSEDATADEKLTGVAATAYAVGSYKDIGILCARRRYRQVDEAAVMPLASTEQNAIQDEHLRQSAYYWAKRTQVSLVSVLQGLFDATSGILKTTHRVSAGVTTGAMKKLAFDYILQGGEKLGDNQGDLALLILHPKQKNDLKREQAAKWSTTQFGPQQYDVYDGKIVIESEQYPVDVTTPTYPIYSAFLIRRGAMMIAPKRSGVKATIQYKNEFPAWTLMETMGYVPHVIGTKWTAAYPADGPANSDLSTATNWAKSATTPSSTTDKEIGVVQILTN